MGVAEARLYRDLARELPVRVPRGVVRRVRGHRHRRRRPLRDGARRSRRVGLPVPDPRRRRHRGRASSTSSSNLARLHAQYWESPRFGAGGDLAWIAPRGTGGGRRRRVDSCRWRSTTSPTGSPTGSCRSPRPTSRDRREILQLYREGECTLVHGDPHLGNLFVDGDRRRTAPASSTGRWSATRPGIRDVAYVLSASTPTELRRTPRARAARALPRGARRARRHARRRPRVGAVPPLHRSTAGARATCTAAMGSKWQPEHIGLGGTERSHDRGARPRLRRPARRPARLTVVCDHSHA